MQDALKFILRIIALATGQWNVDVSSKFGHGVYILRPDWLLEPERTMGLDFARQANGPRHFKKLRVDIHADIDIRTKRLANRSHSLPCKASDRVVGHFVGFGLMWGDLHGCVTVLLHEGFGALCYPGRAVAAGTLVNADLLAALATKQHVHWKPGRFAGNIPQGMLEAADRC